MMLGIGAVIGIFLFGYVEQVHAIVFLPALLLIPLAKLIAVIVSAFSIPAASIGVFIAKITKNRRLAWGIAIAILLVITVSATFILKWKNPDNPWF